MDWSQVIVIVLGNLGIVLPVIFWMRAESRSDTRMMLTMIDNNMSAIREEMKDFHGRLCAIEERYRSK